MFKLLYRKTTIMEINLQREDYTYLTHSWSDNAFKGTFVIRNYVYYIVLFSMFPDWLKIHIPGIRRRNRCAKSRGEKIRAAGNQTWKIKFSDLNKFSERIKETLAREE